MKFVNSLVPLKFQTLNTHYLLHCRLVYLFCTSAKRLKHKKNEYYFGVLIVQQNTTNKKTKKQVTNKSLQRKEATTKINLI